MSETEESRIMLFMITLISEVTEQKVKAHLDHYFKSLAPLKRTIESHMVGRSDSDSQLKLVSN